MNGLPLFDAALDLPKKLGSPLARSKPPHAPGSETSKRAAEGQAPRFTRHMIDYLRALRDRGGMTDHQAARVLDRPVSGICSTRNRLVALGLVKASGREELSEFGCWCTVWIAWDQTP